MRFLTFLLLLGGCADLGDGFGQLLAEPSCVEWDQWCQVQDFQTRLAVGTTLDIRLGSRTTLTSAESVELISADTSVLQVENRTIRAMGPGTAAVLFRVDGRVVDFTHITVEEPTEVALYREGDETPEVVTTAQTIPLGDAVRVRAIPVGASGPLLGDVATTFDVSEDVVAILPGERDIERQLEGVSAGQTSLVMQQLGFEHEIMLRVE